MIISVIYVTKFPYFNWQMRCGFHLNTSELEELAACAASVDMCAWSGVPEPVYSMCRISFQFSSPQLFPWFDVLLISISHVTILKGLFQSHCKWFVKAVLNCELQNHSDGSLLYGLQQVSSRHTELLSRAGELWVWPSVCACTLISEYYQQSTRKSLVKALRSQYTCKQIL